MVDICGKFLYSLALPDNSFMFVFVLVEKGCGDLANIDWCSDTSVFYFIIGVELLSISTHSNAKDFFK